MTYYLFVKSIFDEIPDIDYEIEARSKKEALARFKQLMPSWPDELIQQHMCSEKDLIK